MTRCVQKMSENFLDRLPGEIRNLFYRYMDERDLVSFCKTNKKFHRETLLERQKRINKVTEAFLGLSRMAPTPYGLGQRPGVSSIHGDNENIIYSSIKLCYFLTSIEIQRSIFSRLSQENLNPKVKSKIFYDIFGAKENSKDFSTFEDGLKKKQYVSNSKNLVKNTKKSLHDYLKHHPETCFTSYKSCGVLCFYYFLISEKEKNNFSSFVKESTTRINSIYLSKIDHIREKTDETFRDLNLDAFIR